MSRIFTAEIAEELPLEGPRPRGPKAGQRGRCPSRRSFGSSSIFAISSARFPLFPPSPLCPLWFPSYPVRRPPPTRTDPFSFTRNRNPDFHRNPGGIQIETARITSTIKITIRRRPDPPPARLPPRSARRGRTPGDQSAGPSRPRCRGLGAVFSRRLFTHDGRG